MTCLAKGKCIISFRKSQGGEQQNEEKTEQIIATLKAQLFDFIKTTKKKSNNFDRQNARKEITMTEIRIFESTKTLEVTKTFAKAASRYGSEAYMKLRSARNDFPDFKVVVRSTAAKKKDSFKGLTYAYMEKYIEAHDDEKGTAMKKFLDLRGRSDEAKEALAESCSYKEIKKWFLGQYTEINEFHSTRAALFESTAV